jgi:hypothetical protein
MKPLVVKTQSLGPGVQQPSRQDLERQLLASLEARVLHPEVVAYTLRRFEEELEKALATRSQGDADLRRQ